MSENIFNQVEIPGNMLDKVQIYLSWGVCSMMVISLNSTELTQKVLIFVSSESYFFDKTWRSKLGLTLQIFLSTGVTIMSFTLIKSQKKAVDMLINFSAVWALNHFDNFSYIMFESQMKKNHQSILQSDNFMKIKVS